MYSTDEKSPQSNSETTFVNDPAQTVKYFNSFDFTYDAETGHLEIISPAKNLFLDSYEITDNGVNIIYRFTNYRDKSITIDKKPLFLYNPFNKPESDKFDSSRRILVQQLKKIYEASTGKEAPSFEYNGFNDLITGYIDPIPADRTVSILMEFDDYSIDNKETAYCKFYTDLTNNWISATPESLDIKSVKHAAKTYLGKDSVDSKATITSQKEDIDKVFPSGIKASDDDLASLMGDIV